MVERRTVIRAMTMTKWIVDWNQQTNLACLCLVGRAGSAFRYDGSAFDVKLQSNCYCHRVKEDRIGHKCLWIERKWNVIYKIVFHYLSLIPLDYFNNQDPWQIHIIILGSVITSTANRNSYPLLSSFADRLLSETRRREVPICPSANDLA